MVLIASIFALCGFIKALKDGLVFRVSYSRLAKLFPHFFGYNNWRWVYKHRNPKFGYKYNAVQRAILTPFMSGWHLLDAVQLLGYCGAICLAIHISILWAFALWILHQVCFTAIWKTPIIETE
jgi:hypothetical protein